MEEPNNVTCCRVDLNLCVVSRRSNVVLFRLSLFLAALIDRLLYRGRHLVDRRSLRTADGFIADSDPQQLQLHFHCRSADRPEML